MHHLTKLEFCASGALGLVTKLALTLGFASTVCATPQAGADDSRERVRFFLAQSAVPLRELLVALAGESGQVIDLGGREVAGVLEVARDERGLTRNDLWRLVHERLAHAGLAIVQRPDHDALSLVPMGEAPTLARIEPDGLASASAGYVRVLYRCKSGAPRALAGALTELTPKDRTHVTALESAQHLVLAGSVAEVRQALQALELIDGAPIEFGTLEVPLRYLAPLTMATRLEQIVQKQTPTGGRPAGWFFALPEAGSVLLGAPVAELPRWRALVERLDGAGLMETRPYVPRRFALADVAALVKDILGAANENPLVRLVQDELTGTLLLSAPPSLHARVEALFERLEGAAPGALTELRAFELRFRDAKEIAERLERLLDVEAARPADDGGTPAPVAAPGRALRLVVDEATNRLLVHAEARVLRQIELLLTALDTHEPEVLVEAVLVSLTEREARQLGLELRGALTAGSTKVELASLFGLGAPPLLGAAPNLGGSGAAATILNPGDFSAVLRALETVQLGRSVARPRALTRNHGTVELDSVLSSPFAATVSTDVVATTTFGGSSEAGTQISVTPHLTAGDRLRVEYAITLSAFVGDPSDPALPPPKQQTVLKSEALVPDGFTVALGGIELESFGRTESRVPLLGRLPLLGALFRDTSRASEITRTFIFLRCDVQRSETFRGLRDLSEREARALGLAADTPSLEPRWMR